MVWLVGCLQDLGRALPEASGKSPSRHGKVPSMQQTPKADEKTHGRRFSLHCICTEGEISDVGGPRMAYQQCKEVLLWSTETLQGSLDVSQNNLKHPQARAMAGQVAKLDERARELGLEPIPSTYIKSLA